jgi:hypothetical protein
MGTPMRREESIGIGQTDIVDREINVSHLQCSFTDGRAVRDLKPNEEASLDQNARLSLNPHVVVVPVGICDTELLDDFFIQEPVVLAEHEQIDQTILHEAVEWDCQHVRTDGLGVAPVMCENSIGMFQAASRS